MINTQLKFQAKIQHGSNVATLTRNHTKTQKFQFQLGLESQGQGHQYSKPYKAIRCSMKSSSWKTNLEMVKLLKVRTEILFYV